MEDNARIWLFELNEALDHASFKSKVEMKNKKMGKPASISRSFNKAWRTCPSWLRASNKPEEPEEGGFPRDLHLKGKLDKIDLIQDTSSKDCT